MQINKLTNFKNENRFHTIDIIRGLAALSVLISHWGNWVEQYANDFTKKAILILQAPINFIWQAGGTHPGVVIFIVLSGFCIHLSVEKNKNQIKNKDFWKVYFLRRSMRIYPVYWFALLIGLVVTFYISSSTEVNINLIVSFIMAFVGIAELIRQAGVLHYLYLGNPPLGTVGVEILLYASYPIYRFFYRLGGSYLLLLFMSICYLIFIYMRWKGVAIELSLGSYFEFAPYWIWGAMSAEIYSLHLKSILIRRYLTICIVFFSVIYIILISKIQYLGLYILSTPLLAIITGLFLAIVLDREVRLKKNYLKIPFLSAIGERGYSLYALHTPIIFLGLYLLNQYEVPTWTYPIFTLMFVVVATEFCYRVIESPAHRFARKISNNHQPLNSK